MSVFLQIVDYDKKPFHYIIIKIHCNILYLNYLQYYMHCVEMHYIHYMETMHCIVITLR